MCTFCLQVYLQKAPYPTTSAPYKRKRKAIAKFIYGSGLPPHLVDNGFFDELVAELTDGSMPTTSAR